MKIPHALGLFIRRIAPRTRFDELTADELSEYLRVSHMPDLDPQLRAIARRMLDRYGNQASVPLMAHLQRVYEPLRTIAPGAIRASLRRARAHLRDLMNERK